MKSERNIFVAFVLNLAFSVFELIGGLFTGSVAIMSDALHDLGDASSIGISYILERKSKRQPDETYTYGYARYSVIGSAITTLILLLGSAIVICHAAGRIVNPMGIHYDGMIVFAGIGVIVNLTAAFVTRDGESLNQKAVNLHMLEDVLGWVVVLIGAVIMRFADIAILDPIMSIGVAIFIIIHAVDNLREVICLFLEKTPWGIAVKEVEKSVSRIGGVLDVHHIHIWTMDGQRNYATMHIVTNADPHAIKEQVRNTLAECGIGHVTLELETENEPCSEKCCHVEHGAHHGHHHHQS
ncbi:MAG: cation transporter [Ruminococcaceae bacterium]|nr:cation transporter [Oscillospiraceae bacterium]